MTIAVDFGRKATKQTKHALTHMMSSFRAHGLAVSRVINSAGHDFFFLLNKCWHFLQLKAG